MVFKYFFKYLLYIRLVLSLDIRATIDNVGSGAARLQSSKLANPVPSIATHLAQKDTQRRDPGELLCEPLSIIRPYEIFKFLLIFSKRLKTQPSRGE